MKFAPVLLVTLAVFLLRTAGPLRAAAQDGHEIDINRLGAKLIPISIEGYTGEALSVLKFDLEVQGFEVTGAGATGASVIQVTLTGTISGTTPTFIIAIPAGSCVR